MADISWPSDLPARPDQSGFEATLGSGTVRSSVKAGAPQRRNRSNAKPTRLKASLLLTGTQAESFNVFFCETTVYGCKRFDWADERNVAAEVRFVTAPKLEAADFNVYRASFEYEVL
jgi:hypothetical protein